jgi:hypothetical protein
LPVDDHSSILDRTLALAETPARAQFACFEPVSTRAVNLKAP